MFHLIDSEIALVDGIETAFILQIYTTILLITVLLINKKRNTSHDKKELE